MLPNNVTHFELLRSGIYRKSHYNYKERPWDRVDWHYKLLSSNSLLVGVGGGGGVGHRRKGVGNLANASQ